MTFIDWSDTEDMLGLLVEYVHDARNEHVNDPKRKRFLSELLIPLGKLADQFPALSTRETLGRLKKIHASIDEEFVDDPVSDHLRDCIHELSVKES